MDLTNVDAIAASNIFYYTENSYYEALKYLNSKKCNVRPPIISELVINNSIMVSQLKNSQDILIKSQTDSINLTESIQYLSELSKSLKQQGDKYKNIIEGQKNREEQEREFFALIQRKQYKESVELLETLEFRSFIHDSANFFMAFS